MSLSIADDDESSPSPHSDVFECDELEAQRHPYWFPRDMAWMNENDTLNKDNVVNRYDLSKHPFLRQDWFDDDFSVLDLELFLPTIADPRDQERPSRLLLGVIVTVVVVLVAGVIVTAIVVFAAARA